MNCERFEELLDDFVAGRLSDVERRAAESHQAGCARCAPLAAAFGHALESLDLASLIEPAGVPAPDLTGSIVERTSGGACSRAQGLLCDLVDALLPVEETQLVHAHLEHCSRCAALHRSLLWLQVQLPRLAEMQPDANLAADIVGATVGHHPRRAPLRDSWRDWWRGLVARPRFAWEMAYVATLVLVVLFGTSSSPFRSVPARALAVIQVDPRIAVGTAAGELRALHGGIGDLGTWTWDATGGRMIDRGRAASSAYASRHPGMHEAWSDLRAHGDELRRHMSERNFAGISVVLDALWQDTTAVWRSMSASAATPPKP